VNNGIHFAVNIAVHIAVQTSLDPHGAHIFPLHDSIPIPKKEG
jgi:hypothetical protein